MTGVRWSRYGRLNQGAGVRLWDSLYFASTASNQEEHQNYHSTSSTETNDHSMPDWFTCCAALVSPWR